MKQQLWLGTIFLGLNIGVAAQTPQTTPTIATPTFTSRSEAVLVPVAVRDKSGQVASGLKQVASGLKKEAFRLIVDGRPVQIASFEEVKSGVAPALLPIERGVYTNRIANEDRPQRLTVLLLDYLNTPFLNQEEERQEVAKFVSHELKPDEPVALLSLTGRGLRLLQTFTTNSGDLTIAARKSRLNRPEANGLHWVGPMPQDPLGRFIIADRIRTTLEELEQLGNALAGVPGRKVVVWITGGFPYMPYDRHSLTRQNTEFLDDYRRMWHSLNQANVSLYPIDAKGLVNTLFERRFSAERGRAPLNSRNLPGLRYDVFQEEQDTLKNFAAETGGIACVNRNQYESCIEAAQSEAVDYYLLSFSVAPEMHSKNWHKIDVKVDGKYEVRARQGFTLEKPNVPDASDELKLMAKALRSPLEYTGLKMSFKWLGVTPIRAGSVIPQVPDKSPAAKYPPAAVAKFRLELPPRAVEVDTANNNRIELSMMAVGLDNKGEYVCELAKGIDAKLNETELRQSDTSGITLENEVALPTGRLRVRFAVRDRMTGRIGTIEVPIDVPGQ